METAKACERQEQPHREEWEGRWAIVRPWREGLTRSCPELEEAVQKGQKEGQRSTVSMDEEVRREVLTSVASVISASASVLVERCDPVRAKEEDCVRPVLRAALRLELESLDLGEVGW